MTKRRTRPTTRQRPLPREIEKEIEEEDVDIEDEEEDVDVEDEVEEQPAPRQRARRTTKTTRVKPASKTTRVKPASKTTRVKPASKTTRDESTPAIEPEDEEDKTIGKISRSDLAPVMFDLLNQGVKIVMRRMGNQIIFSKLDPEEFKSVEQPQATGKPSRGERSITVKEMRAYAQTADYIEFDEWWSALSFEEKVAEAEDDDVEWERHDNPLVDNLRLTMAMQEARGIEKWKPEYATRAARNDLLRHGIPTDAESND